MSTLFLRTLREDPADAEVASHRLLVRGGYIRRAAPGGFTWLPLGWIVYRNVENIVRAEMDLFVGLTACSAEKSNGGVCKPIDFDVVRAGARNEELEHVHAQPR